MPVIFVWAHTKERRINLPDVHAPAFGQRSSLVLDGFIVAVYAENIEHDSCFQLFDELLAGRRIELLARLLVQIVVLLWHAYLSHNGKLAVFILAGVGTLDIGINH